jgi:uncharacterized protein
LAILTVNREPWVDALRALALLGVFIVNAMGYLSAPNYPMPLGLPIPSDSILAIGVNGFLAAFAQGKAYPLLCFLFGYSLCCIAFKKYAAVNSDKLIVKALNLRYKKLLLIGILHGVFVYFGDVLTIYAICGFVASKWVKYRPKRLLKIFRNLTKWVIGIFILYMLAALMFWFDSGDTESSFARDMLENFANVSIKSFWLLNATTYFSITKYALFTLPIYLWLTVAGILTRRFRLFTLRSYARIFWRKHLNKSHFIVAMLLNILISVGISFQQMDVSLSKLIAMGAISTPVNIWLVATVLAIGMRHWHKTSQLPRWMLWLAPAGKHTLAMYLTLSVTLMLTSGAFLGLQGSTMDRFIVVLLAWVGVVSLARYATKLGIRDPFAHWMSANYSGVKASDLVKISNSNK